MRSELNLRTSPTNEEWKAGTFIERIEPIVRDATIELRKKGYNTNSSGFWRLTDASCFNFNISWHQAPKETNQKISKTTKHAVFACLTKAEKLQVIIKSREILVNGIGITDMDVKQLFDKISNLLPVVGDNKCSTTPAAVKFRSRYCN